MKLMLCGWILLFFMGCSVNAPTPPSSVSEELTHMLVEQLDVPYKEANALATQAQNYAQGFKQRYALVKPPMFHNLLVNLGIKERGLCWHFAYDLLEHLKAQDYKEFDYYMGWSTY